MHRKYGDHKFSVPLIRKECYPYLKSPFSKWGEIVYRYILNPLPEGEEILLYSIPFKGRAGWGWGWFPVPFTHRLYRQSGCKLGIARVYEFHGAVKSVAATPDSVTFTKKEMPPVRL